MCERLLVFRKAFVPFGSEKKSLSLHEMFASSRLWFVDGTPVSVCWSLKRLLYN